MLLIDNNTKMLLKSLLLTTGTVLIIGKNVSGFRMEISSHYGLLQKLFAPGGSLSHIKATAKIHLAV
jgi:hypothetical protein